MEVAMEVAMEAPVDILELLIIYGYFFVLFVLIAIPVSIYEAIDRHFIKIEENKLKPASHIRQHVKQYKEGKVKYQIKTTNAELYAQESYKVRANRLNK
jgi:hypothetical protein